MTKASKHDEERVEDIVLEIKVYPRGKPDVWGYFSFKEYEDVLMDNLDRAPPPWEYKEFASVREAVGFNWPSLEHLKRSSYRLDDGIDPVLLEDLEEEGTVIRVCGDELYMEDMAPTKFQVAEEYARLGTSHYEVITVHEACRRTMKRPDPKMRKSHEVRSAIVQALAGVCPYSEKLEALEL